MYALDRRLSLQGLLFLFQEDATPLLTTTRQAIANPDPSLDQPSFQSPPTSPPGLFFSRKRPGPAKIDADTTKKYRPLATEEEAGQGHGIATTDHSDKDYVFPWRAGARKKVKQECSATSSTPQVTYSSTDLYLKLRRYARTHTHTHTQRRLWTRSGLSLTYTVLAG